MESDYLYQPFPHFIFRTPLYPFDLLPEKDYTHPSFDEALYLASVAFYREKQKAQQKPGLPDQKLSFSLYKYYSRACTRCTPFGLFAGCSVGKISGRNRIVVEDPDHCQRYTRPDMNYLCSLIQYIERLPDIKSQLKYFTNDSIYRLGDKIRYTEYYYKGTGRIHSIQSVDAEEYLLLILHQARTGKRIRELADLLLSPGISFGEAEEFIYELIDNQLLKSELEPAVTGTDILEDLTGKLANLEHTEKLVAVLTAVRDELDRIDRRENADAISGYEKIATLLKTFPVTYDEKYLFQTDVFKRTVEASVAEEVISDINEALRFLMQIKMNASQGETRLDKFRNVFAERYGEEEIPLLQVMDPESGIGYPVERGGSTINPLLDNLPPGGKNIKNATYLSPEECLLLKKYTDMLREGKECIQLSDTDVVQSRPDPDKLPVTFSVMSQILQTGDRNLVYLHSAGGTTSASLLGRFCHLDEKIKNHVLEITGKEQAAEPAAILAEIVHLPESRIGNISFRPLLREYEIHYLARPGVRREKAVPASDLFLSVKHNRLLLRSEELDAEIIPRLSNAHNYAANSVPLYHFLCDLQSQDKRSGFSLYAGNLLHICRTFPRVVYKDIILLRAGWLVEEKEIEEAGTISRWREKRGIPQRVVIQDADNELFINFGDPVSGDAFLTLLKRRKGVTLSEFLFDETRAVVRDTEGRPYCSEFIFSFYKL